MLGGLSALRTLALQKVERSSSDFRGVEFLEQWLERDCLAWRNATAQYGAELLPDHFLTIVGATLWSSEIEWRKASTGELSQPWQLRGSRHHDDLDGLRLRDALELRWNERRLIKDHGVRGRLEITVGRPKIRVVVVIAERPQGAARFIERTFLPRDNERGWGVEVIEQTPQRAGSRGGCDRHVPDDRQLVVLRYLRRFGVRDPNSPRTAGVALDEILDRRCDFARDDNAVRLG
jgi:hypothetical protein